MVNGSQDGKEWHQDSEDYTPETGGGSGRKKGNDTLLVGDSSRPQESSTCGASMNRGGGGGGGGGGGHGDWGGSGVGWGVLSALSKGRSDKGGTRTSESQIPL